MMRFLLGAVLITLQLCVSVGRAQDEEDVIACYTHCRSNLQDSVEGWSCDGNEECNCKTKGYLSRLACCMLDRCEVEDPKISFSIPCTPEDGGEIEYAAASCKAEDRTSTKTTETEEPTSTTEGGRMGANNASETSTTDSDEDNATSTTASNTRESSTEATTTSPPEQTGEGNEAPNSEQSNNSDNGSDNSLVLGLGLGLGIPLALAAIGLIAFLIYRRRKRNNLNQREVDDPRQTADPKMNPFASPSPPPHDSPVYEMFSPTGAEDDDDVPPLAPSVFNDSASARMSELSAGDVPGPTTATTRTMTKKGRLSELAAGDIVVPKSSHRSRKSQGSTTSRPSQDRNSQATSHRSGGGPRTWDSRSTLVSTSVGGVVDPRRQSSRPSASIRSRTSEILMRELPDLPPSARTRTPGLVSELP